MDLDLNEDGLISLYKSTFLGAIYGIFAEKYENIEAFGFNC